jgi:hypothetical protein
MMTARGFGALAQGEPVSSGAFRSLCDNAFWCDEAPRENPDFRHGDVVFCKIDEVWRLFRALRRTQKRIVLVTGEGDKPVTPELFAQRPPHVSHWFGMNMFADDPAATPIPLGLGEEGHPATLDGKDIGEMSRQVPARTGLLYANFGTASNPVVREPLRAWLEKPEQEWVTRHDHGGSSGKAAYLEALCSHHFVFCPPGNGEDTHRMWEALYAGAVPVVRESPAMRGFRDLPVLFVPRLEGISEDLLRAHAQGGAIKNGSRTKLDLAFWADEFSEAKAVAGEKGPVGPGEWTKAWGQEIRRVIWRTH